MASDVDMLKRSGDRSTTVFSSNGGVEGARGRPRSTAAWSRGGKQSLAWLLPLAFLALPDCSYNSRRLAEFHRGDHQPFSSRIFCDIEDMNVPRHCANDGELVMGVPLTRAAVALVEPGEKPSVALDYSPSAIDTAGCPPGHPVAITYKGNFPTGLDRCLNCGEAIPSYHADVNAACVALCQDVHTDDDEDEVSDEVVAFCTTHARASTNAGSCFEGACTPMGVADSDPRRTPEPLVWQDLSVPGVTASGNTLTRTALDDCPNPGDPGECSFDEGAAGTQTITRGDGYVEFVVSATDRECILGLSPGAPPDGDPSDQDIAFGFRLADTGLGGRVMEISENGILQHDDSNPNPDDYSWGALETGDRVRISVQDQLDGTATVTYWHLLPGCDGATCVGNPLRTVGPAPYPFRVDASLGAQGATLTDVRIVRIK